MKKVLILMLVAIVAMAMVWGCGQKADDAGKTPADVKEAESIDTTRLDSAMEAVDSLIDEGAEAVKDAAEEGADAVKEAAGK